MDDRKQELIKAIKDQIPYVDIKPYSHNIIGLKLQMLSTEYGQEESNKLIRETKLKDIGWTVIEEDCNCILRGNNICYNEFNCENCGECLNWKGYEEGTKNCGECRLNLNKDLN